MAKKINLDWSKITKKINEQEKPFVKKVDERLYQIKTQKDGTAQAVIRFLWSKDTDVPFAKKYSHGFRGVGGWYIEDCPTTNGKPCPVCKANSAAWNADDKDTARARARRLSCYSNILVVKDPQTPENEGKVFLFRYGKKIHDKIMEKIAPKEGGIEEPVMVFDPYEGANFKLIVKTVNTTLPDGSKKSYLNYDSSSFAEKTKIGSDAKVEEIDKSLYGLSEFVDPSSIKTFDELADRFTVVLGEGAATPAPTPQAEEATTASEEPAPGVSEAGEDTESDNAFFSKLREE